MNKTSRALERKDKGTKKRRDEADPATSSLSNEIDGGIASRQILSDEDVKNLKIAQNALHQVAMSGNFAEYTRPKVPVLVKTQKLQPIENKSTKSLNVARPVETRPIELREINNDTAVRFDSEGNPLEHSILGRLDEFVLEAKRCGDSSNLPFTPDGKIIDCDAPKPSSVIDDRARPPFLKRPSNDKPVDDSSSNALLNYQKRMAQRRQQQCALASRLDKEHHELIMNDGDFYRQKQELRELIDNSLPLVDYGKGYRFKSEFWNQPLLFGDELGGIHTSLGLAQQGNAPPMEFVGIPNNVKCEKGTPWDLRPNSSYAKPWHRCEYVKKRLVDVKGLINEFYPHLPEYDTLEIVGRSYDKLDKGSPMTDSADKLSDIAENFDAQSNDIEKESEKVENDPLSEYPDDVSIPVMGPSILFAGQQASWTGDDTSYKGTVALEARVTFESFIGEHCSAYLDVSNNGTTAIYFQWAKEPANNPFDIYKESVQRFYFDTTGDVILSGGSKRFHFVFKSAQAGVFTERWHFLTKPVVAGGASLIVTLRGVCVQADVYRKHRTEIESFLRHREAHRISKQILSSLVSAIRTPPRPCTPIDAYITKQDAFERINPGMKFRTRYVHLLKELIVERERRCAETFNAGLPFEGDIEGGLVSRPSSEKQTEKAESADDEYAEQLRSLDVSGLKACSVKYMLMDLDEDLDAKEELLQRLNNVATELASSDPIPISTAAYTIGYGNLQEAVDSFVEQSQVLRRNLGLLEKPVDEMASTEFFESQQGLRKKQQKLSVRQRLNGKSVAYGTMYSVTSLSSYPTIGSRRRPRRSSIAVIALLSRILASRSATSSASAADTRSKSRDKASREKRLSKKMPSEISKGREPSAKVRSEADTRSVKSISSAVSDDKVSAAPATDTELDQKYREKLYLQTYSILGAYITRMENLFDSLKTENVC